ncbi:MAG: hypothetical protein JXR46_13340 [Calditrichaceae bacterium]|nr:hypothetical protein [Calditrichaceae bacterium]MBN2710020.1 hypothetical protein [Calditrichaceae bacterium]RQV93676.1 MAG: hypothetical protein EH224_11975 [Calditrichota bacterium]
MKALVSYTLFLLLITGCQKEATDISASIDQIDFSTDKQSYTLLDSIKLNLTNNTDDDIIIELRCGFYLEMFYQKKENSNWSDDLWFGYMSLRCPTELDTIPASSTYTHSLHANIFNSTGTFRLLVEVHKPTMNNSETIISNSFKIE